jgi:hypothetical protein
VKKRDILTGTGLALSSPVPETSTPLVYREPTVMWRMRRSDGRRSHALIRLHKDGAIVIWFVNDRPMGCRGFSDMGGALSLSDQMMTENLAAGWRLVPE